VVKILENEKGNQVEVQEKRLRQKLMENKSEEKLANSDTLPLNFQKPMEESSLLIKSGLFPAGKPMTIFGVAKRRDNGELKLPEQR
jgi:hypothetical protein